MGGFYGSGQDDLSRSLLPCIPMLYQVILYSSYIDIHVPMYTWWIAILYIFMLNKFCPSPVSCEKLYRKLKCTDQSSERYAILKNRIGAYNKILKKTIREAQSTYNLLRFTENKTNIRKMWGIVNEIICKYDIKAIMKDGNLTKEPKAVVESSNNFFDSIGPNLVRNIDINPKTSFQTNLTKYIISSFHFGPANKNEVDKILKSLNPKTSSWAGDISVKRLIFSPALIRPLTIIISQSLITSMFPEQLK